jgi:hypothetical protein
MKISYCGLICESCPVHLATIEPDRIKQQELRSNIARQCFEVYGLSIEPAQVTDCDGCCSETGRLFSGCLNCEIRKCIVLKGIENCGYCDEYACERLKQQFIHDPEAEERLNLINMNIRR